jgi:hypothetical protein
MSLYYIDFFNKVDSQLDTNLKINRIKYDPNIIIEDIKVPKKYNSIDWKNLLSPPAKNSSSQTLSELLEISKLVSHRTSKDEELIYLVDKEPLDLFYPILKKYNLVFPEKIFKNAYKDIYDLVIAIKQLYNRPRPYQLAPFFNINIKYIKTKTHNTPSYPSGHTVYAYLAYKIVTSLYPNIPKIDLYNCVYLTGRARMIQGIHYQSDIDAAILLIDKLYDRRLL